MQQEDIISSEFNDEILPTSTEDDQAFIFKMPSSLNSNKVAIESWFEDFLL